MIAIFPEIASAVAAKDVERLAVLIRRYYGGERTSAPAPDMRSLLSHVGVMVREHSMTDYGALLAKDEHGTFRITAVVATQDRGAGPETERFLLAHLLGHYLYDVQPLIAGGDWTVAGFREELCPARRYGTGHPVDSDAREDRADRFAAALLMPLGMTRRAWEKLGDAARVAQIFMVPLGVASRRLEELSLLRASPANFLDAERRMVRPGASFDANGSQETGDSLTEARAIVARKRDPASAGGLERLRAAQHQYTLENASGAPDLEPRTRNASRAGLAQGEAESRLESQSAPTPQPLEERLPPRSFAASTYRATERSTRVPSTEESRVADPETTTTAPASGSLKGLDRIREIARKLDKTRSE